MPPARGHGTEFGVSQRPKKTQDPSRHPHQKNTFDALHGARDVSGRQKNSRTDHGTDNEQCAICKTEITL